MIIHQRLRFRSLLHCMGSALLALLVWDIAVTVAYVTLHCKGGFELPSLPVSLFASALALMLGVRTTAAYARWWEARTLWGNIVNASRSFAREAMHLVSNHPQAQAIKRNMVRRQIVFAQSLRLHLLQLDKTPVLRRLTAGETPCGQHASFANLPNALLGYHAADIAHCHASGWLDSFARVRLESTMVDLSNAQGGLERIRNTPLPLQYGSFLSLFVTVFCVVLPLGLVDSLSYYTPMASTAVGFILIAIDKMGMDLQNPFQNDAHDVPMESICRTIEIDLLQAIGETAPAPVRSVNGVLW